MPIVDGAEVLGALSVAAPSQRFRSEQKLLLNEATRAAAEAVPARAVLRGA